MSWLLLTKTFLAIFIAELGDKTQIATLALAASASSRWTVFVGAALALVASSALAVLAGEAVARVVSPLVIRRAAGVLFVVLGVVFLATNPSSN